MDEFGGAFDGEFVFDVAAMDGDGFVAEVKLGGDFLGGFAFAEEAEDFELAVAEFFNRRIRTARSARRGSS